MIFLTVFFAMILFSLIVLGFLWYNKIRIIRQLEQLLLEYGIAYTSLNNFLSKEELVKQKKENLKSSKHVTTREDKEGNVVGVIKPK